MVLQMNEWEVPKKFFKSEVDVVRENDETRQGGAEG